MLCVEDYIDALEWSKSIGGLDGLVQRADRNVAAMAAWVAKTDWVDFLAESEDIRSNTSVCLKVVDPTIAALPEKEQAAFVKALVAAVEAEQAGYDIDGYRDAPPGLRVWCGATVETTDVQHLTAWLDWAFATAKANMATAA